jgi:hypothetical protein
MQSENSTYNASKGQYDSANNKLWLFLVILIVLCAASFFGGKAYEKGHRFGGFGGGGGEYGGGHRLGGFGKVTAISSSSITVESTYSNSSKTYTINSSTTVTSDGSSASVSTIQTGDTVIIRTSSTASTTATAIEVNPSFGGGPGSSQEGSSTTGSSTTGSQTTTN